MKINISLLNYLGEFVENLGVEKPTILARNTYAVRHSVLIGFDGNNLPFRVLTGSSELPKTFYGQDEHSVTAAEQKAIICLVEDLKKTYGIEIHDTSYRKIKKCEEKFFELLSGMDEFVGKFNVFLSRYISCTDYVGNFITSAQEKYGGLGEVITMVVGDIVEKYRTSTRDLKQKLIITGHDNSEDIIAAAATTKKDPLLAPSIVWELSAKGTLIEILSAVGLDEPKYSSRITDKDLFIGTCKLNIGTWYGNKPTGKTYNEGCVKETPHEAEDSAAAVAVGVLERKRGFEVNDFNYENLKNKRKLLCSLVEHRSKLDALFSESNQSWDNFMKSIEEFIGTQYGLSQGYPLTDEETLEWTVKMGCISDLEEIVSSMKQVHYMAVSDMCARVD